MTRRAVARGALELYADPAYYHHTYRSRRHDVDYYVELARRTGGPVLEYGVGNGRIARAIARAGIDVVGVDLSEPMLGDLAERASRLSRAARERLSWVHGDMRTVRLRRRFALVLAPFNTFLHLYEIRDALDFLDRAREHLAPSAPLVFDISVPLVSDLACDPNRWMAGPRLRHPTTGKLVRYAERFDYDAVRQVLHVEMRFEPLDGSPSWSVPLSHRQFFPQELRALLAAAGYGPCELTADFTSHPAGPDVDSLVVTAWPGRRRRDLARRPLRP